MLQPWSSAVDTRDFVVVACQNLQLLRVEIFPATLSFQLKNHVHNSLKFKRQKYIY